MEELKQLMSKGSWLGPHPQLIPPLADEFSVYGGDDVVERARSWALEDQCVLVEGVDLCAHAFYMMDMCPNTGTGCMGRWADHVNVWCRFDQSKFGPRAEPFLLMHPYLDEIPKSVYKYAMPHGLYVSSDEHDGWYDESAIPIRLEPKQDNIFWPLEKQLLMLYLTEPFSWPE